MTARLVLAVRRRLAALRSARWRAGISRRDVDAADNLPAVVAGVKFQESCCLVLLSPYPLAPAIAALDNSKWLSLLDGFFA